MSARTIARRLSSVSGFYAYLVARGDCRRGGEPGAAGTVDAAAGRAPSARAAGAGAADAAEDPRAGRGPLRCSARCAPTGTGRWCSRWCWAGCGAARSSGCASPTSGCADRSLFIAEGKGGHQRVVPISNAFFTAVGDYLRHERPGDATTDRVFVTLKGPTRGQPMTADGVDKILAAARQRAGLDRGDLPPVAPHLSDPAARSGHGARSGPGPSRARVDRIDPDLPAPQRRRGSPMNTAGHRCSIDADHRRAARGRRRSTR
ncbi:MAG: tyrosine-type recombinase/integrase [Microthrixaceae bacterium]